MKANVILCGSRSKTKDSLGIVTQYDCTRKAIVEVIYNDVTGQEQKQCFCKMHLNSFQSWIKRVSKILQNPSFAEYKSTPINS